MLNYGLSLVVQLKLESNSAIVTDFRKSFTKEDLKEFGALTDGYLMAICSTVNGSYKRKTGKGDFDCTSV